MGWPTLARLIVADADAPRGRVLALDFERRLSTGDGSPSFAPLDAATVDISSAWPCCPECGKRR